MSPESGNRFRDKDMRKNQPKAHGANLKDRDALWPSNAALGTSNVQRIASLDDIAAGLDALCLIDPRLEKVRGMAGEVPLRLSEPGFRSLASIIVSQQVSRASADAIFGRLT